MQFADDMLTKDPNNKLYLYVKAYLYHNMKEYDQAIDFYKKTIEVDPQYAEAYSNLGLVLLMKAQDFADQSTTDVNDPKYAEAQATIKKFYEEAKPYYEKARDLKPDQKDLWAPGLYRVYYNLNMGPEFDEIEKKRLIFHCGASTYSAELMAKKSWIARDKKKADTVKRYAELREQLKAEKDYIGLTMLPRNASPTRMVNRCLVSGRRRAFIRRFKLSRISFRELANAGMIPGVTKSSW